jgi:hypothetical protein
MRLPTLVLLMLLFALTTGVAALDARLVVLTRTRPVVLPLAATERMPHTERVELDAVPVATRVSVANATQVFQLRFDLPSDVLDGSVGLIEAGNGFVINPEFQGLHPRAIAAEPHLANAPLVGGVSSGTDLFFVDQYSLGVSLRENSDEFEMPLVIRVCPPSTDLAANETDEWLR